MSELVVETPEGVALRFEIAGVGTRLLAASLDGLVFALVLLLGVLFFLVAGVEPGYVWLVSGTFLWLAGYSFVFSMLWIPRHEIRHIDLAS